MHALEILWVVTVGERGKVRVEGLHYYLTNLGLFPSTVEKGKVTNNPPLATLGANPSTSTSFHSHKTCSLLLVIHNLQFQLRPS